MRRVLVRYHREPEGCWAESPDAPGWSAAGSTLDEVRALALEGLKWQLGDDVHIDEDLSAITGIETG